MTEAVRATFGGAAIEKRASRACDACRRKKIKCDCIKPRCDACEHSDIPCTYMRPHRSCKKNAKCLSVPTSTALEKPHSTLLLERRINRLEEVLRGVSRTVVMRRDAVVPRPLQLTEPQSCLVLGYCKSYFENAVIGDISSRIGFPFFTIQGQEWILKQSGKTIDFQKLTIQLRGALRHKLQQSPDGFFELMPFSPEFFPRRDVVESFLRVYSLSKQRLILPVINPDLFARTLDLAYDNNNDNNVVEKACVLSFVALCSKTNQRNLALPEVNDAEYALAALRLIPMISNEPTSVAGVETVLMLAFYSVLSGNLQAADMLISTAVRMIFRLGGHLTACTFSYGPFPLAERREPLIQTSAHLRELFWICYTIDKDMCLRIGRVTSIDDEACDLALPPSYFDYIVLDMLPEVMPDPTDWGPFFPTDLRLAIIKSKAYSELYSTKALKKSDAELLRSIRELDEELYQWKTSTSSRYFNCQFPICLGPGSGAINVHIVMLRLEYYHCQAMIHRASSRCHSIGDSMPQGLRSSLELSLEASRSTILYLDSMSKILGRADNMDNLFLLFYPLSSLLSVFLNVLQNPSDPRAVEDFALLAMSPARLSSLPEELLSKDDVIKLRIMTEFLRELGEVAKQGMTRALIR